MVSPSASRPPPVESPRHVLPKDLTAALKQLGDDELARLLAAATVEQKRRRGKLGRLKTTSKRPEDAAGLSLTTNKLNAVRAAFKAGIKPMRIARQFGLSDGDVQKALATYNKKR